MPRGVRKQINYDEEINKIDMRITRYENTIKELKEERAKLETQKKQHEISALYEALQTSGLSIDEAISSLKSDTEKTGSVA